MLRATGCQGGGTGSPPDLGGGRRVRAGGSYRTLIPKPQSLVEGGGSYDVGKSEMWCPCFPRENVNLFSGKADPSGPWSTELNAALGIVLFVLNDRISDGEKQRVFESMLDSAGQIEVAVWLTNALLESKATKIYRLQNSVDSSLAKTRIGERFEREFIKPGADIFEKSRRPTYVLYQIGHFGPEFESAISKYTLRLCETNPRCIGKLTVSFLSGSPDATPQLRLDQLKSVVDAEQLAAMAKKAGENAWSTEKEREAVEELLQITDHDKS